ncbi:MAG: hypothetical protein Q7W05_14310 [Deltaproteobacteria bacterium]|nr:hypothetical protein [Deltaproteobacteria bacterium]
MKIERYANEDVWYTAILGSGEATGDGSTPFDVSVPVSILKRLLINLPRIIENHEKSGIENARFGYNLVKFSIPNDETVEIVDVAQRPPDERSGWVVRGVAQPCQRGSRRSQLYWPDRRSAERAGWLAGQ